MFIYCVIFFANFFSSSVAFYIVKKAYFLTYILRLLIFFKNLILSIFYTLNFRFHRAYPGRLIMSSVFSNGASLDTRWCFSLRKSFFLGSDKCTAVDLFIVFSVFSVCEFKLLTAIATRLPSSHDSIWVLDDFHQKKNYTKIRFYVNVLLFLIRYFALGRWFL